MKIEKIADRKIWDNFLKKNSNGNFLQTWEWGDFQSEGLGKKVWRFGFRKNLDLIGLALLIEETSRFGKFLYCPRGPIIDWGNEQERVECLKILVEYLKNRGYVFLRLEPAVKKESNFDWIGFRDAVNFVQAERSWVLDIKGKSDEELMLGMRKNARYSLRKAMRNDLDVGISENEDDFNIFVKMLIELADKKGFVSVPPNYLKTQFKTMGNIMKFFSAKQNGKIIAGGWFAFYGDESSYLHGASCEDIGDTQAPYLIQWEAIKYARQMGLKRHNFWGIVEDKKYKPSYPGFGYSNFKKGFGGYLEEYIRAKDFVYNVIKYQPIRLNEWYRKVRYKGN